MTILLFKCNCLKQKLYYEGKWLNLNTLVQNASMKHYCLKYFIIKFIVRLVIKKNFIYTVHTQRDRCVDMSIVKILL